SPVVAGDDGGLLEVLRLKICAAGVLVVVLIARHGWRAELVKAVVTKILRAEALAGFLVGTDENNCLAASLNGEIRLVIGIEAKAGMVEVVASHQCRPPIDDPAFAGAEAVIEFLLGFANINAVDETGDGNEAGGDVVVLAVVGEVQALTLNFKAFGRAGVVISVAAVAGTERIEIGFTA